MKLWNNPDNNKLSILVIEDQREIAQNIAEYFEPKGHILDFAINGHAGLKMALTEHFDVILVDIMLPGLSGWDICTSIRQQADRHIPILMLTAMDKQTDKIKGLSLGADDYLTKPFSLKELELRCISLVRRNTKSPHKILTIGELSIDKTHRRVSRCGQHIQLKKMPYDILLCLANNYPNIVSRSELCKNLWGDEYNESDSLRSHIYQLRQALDKPFSFPMVTTLHNIGFTLSEQPNE